MLKFAVGLKTKAGARVASVAPKTLKMRFSGKITPCLKNFETVLGKFSWRHRFTFYVKMSRKTSTGKSGSGWNGALIFSVTIKKVRKMRFRFRFAGVTAEKVIFYEYTIMPLAYNKAVCWLLVKNRFAPHLATGIGEFFNATNQATNSQARHQCTVLVSGYRQTLHCEPRGCRL